MVGYLLMFSVYVLIHLATQRKRSQESSWYWVQEVGERHYKQEKLTIGKVAIVFGWISCSQDLLKVNNWFHTYI